MFKKNLDRQVWTHRTWTYLLTHFTFAVTENLISDPQSQEEKKGTTVISDSQVKVQALNRRNLKKFKIFFRETKILHD